jgi:hypothetical protein
MQRLGEGDEGISIWIGCQRVVYNAFNSLLCRWTILFAYEKAYPPDQLHTLEVLRHQVLQVVYGAVGKFV